MVAQIIFIKMKKLLFPLIFLTSYSCIGQVTYKFNLKQNAIPLSSMFMAGVCEGFMDYLDFHYDGNNQFWQPDISWTNKYIDRDPSKGQSFQGKYLTFTTDGWHLLKFGRNLFTVGAITFKVVKGKRKKWYYYVLDGAIYWITNRAAFNLSYNLFKH